MTHLSTQQPSKKVDIDLYSWAVNLKAGGHVEGGVGYDDEGNLGHDITDSHHRGAMTVEEAQQVAQHVLQTARVLAQELATSSSVQDRLDRGEAPLMGRMNASPFTGACPPWCTDNHAIDGLEVNGQGWSRLHTGIEIELGDRVKIAVDSLEQAVVDGPLVSWLEPVEIEVWAKGDSITPDEARQLAAALMAAADKVDLAGGAQ